MLLAISLSCVQGARAYFPLAFEEVQLSWVSLFDLLFKNESTMSCYFQTEFTILLLSFPKACKQLSQNGSRDPPFTYMKIAAPDYGSQLVSYVRRPGGLHPCCGLLQHFPYNIASLASIPLNIYIFENPARLTWNLWLALMFVVKEKLYVKLTEKSIFN